MSCAGRFGRRSCVAVACDVLTAGAGDVIAEARLTPLARGGRGRRCRARASSGRKARPRASPPPPRSPPSAQLPWRPCAGGPWCGLGFSTASTAPAPRSRSSTSPAGRSHSRSRTRSHCDLTPDHPRRASLMGPPSQCSGGVKSGGARVGRAPRGEAGWADALVRGRRGQVSSASAGLGHKRPVGAWWRFDGLLEQAIEEHPASA